MKALLKILRGTGIGKTNKGQRSEVQDLCHLGIEQRFPDQGPNGSWVLCIIFWVAITGFECAKTPPNDLMSEFKFYRKICVSDSRLTATSEMGRETSLVSWTSWQTLFVWNPFCAIPGSWNMPDFCSVRSQEFMSSSYYRTVLFKVVLVFWWLEWELWYPLLVRLISAFSIGSPLHNRNWRQKSLDVGWLKSIDTEVSGMMAAAENLHWDLQTAEFWDQLRQRAGVNGNCYHLFSLK